MRHQSWPAMLALGSLVLAACGDETTAPSEASASPATAAVTSNAWITRADMLTTRTDLAVATVPNAAGQSIVYTIGGRNPNGVPLKTVSAYNVATNTWTFRRALPVALAWTNGAAVINGKIYVSGGFSDYNQYHLSHALYMYDPATNTWTRKHDMPSVHGPYGSGDPRYVGAQGVTGVINRKLYVVSTCYWIEGPIQSYYESTCYGKGVGPAFFRYDPATDRWAVLPSPPWGPSAESPFEGGVLGTKLYVMGGTWDGLDGQMAAYDPATNRWTKKTALALERPGAATAVLDGKLFVMGGYRYNSARETSDLLDITIVYDPATDAWTRRAPLPSPRASIAGTTVMVNGKPRIELIGGLPPGNNLQYVP
jgi:hypothetical protein